MSRAISIIDISRCFTFVTIRRKTGFDLRKQDKQVSISSYKYQETKNMNKVETNTSCQRELQLQRRMKTIIIY